MMGEVKEQDLLMCDDFMAYGGGPASSFIAPPEMQALAFCPSALVLYDVPFDASTGTLKITR